MSATRIDWGQAPWVQVRGVREDIQKQQALGRLKLLSRHSSTANEIDNTLVLFGQYIAAKQSESDPRWERVVGGRRFRLQEYIAPMEAFFASDPDQDFGTCMLPDILEGIHHDPRRDAAAGDGARAAAGAAAAAGGGQAAPLRRNPPRAARQAPPPPDDAGGGGGDQRDADQPQAGDDEDGPLAVEHDGRMDVRTALAQRRVHLDALLCRYVWLLLDGDLTAVIKGHLHEHYNGEAVAVGTREMWDLVCAQARSNAQPRDVVGVWLHLQRAVREVDDVLAVLTTVRDWEATMYQGVSDRDVTDFLWHHGWGRRVFETLFLSGVQRDDRSVDNWTAIINRLDVDAYRARLNAALRYRVRRDQPAAPGAARLGGGANRPDKAATVADRQDRQQDRPGQHERRGQSAVVRAHVVAVRAVPDAAGRAAAGGAASKRCWHCHEPGHERAECPKYKAGLPAASKPPRAAEERRGQVRAGRGYGGGRGGGAGKGRGGGHSFNRPQAQVRILRVPGGVRVVVDSETAPPSEGDEQDAGDQTYDFGGYSPLAWTVAAELENDGGEQQQGYAAAFPPLPRRARARRTATAAGTDRITHSFEEVMAWAAATAGDHSRTAVVAEAAAAGDELRLVGSTCRGPDARERRVVVLLDTGSTATFLSSTVFQLERELEQPLECAGASGDFEVRRQGYALLWMERGAGSGWVRVHGYEHAVPAGVDVLLGNRALQDLEVAIPPPSAVDTPWTNLPRLADSGATTTEAGRRKPQPEVAAWSDHLMGEFLIEHPESLEDEHYDVGEVQLAGELADQQQAELRALVREYSDIFATTDVPPASTAYAETFGAVDAASMLKPGVTRFPHVSPPHFLPHHAAFLAAWARRLVEHGVLVRHPRSPVASRALVATRQTRTGRKPRVCLDLRALNDLFAPAQGEFTNGHAELQRAARPAAYRMEADLCAAYWQIPVAPASQFLFCFWLPVETAPGKFEAQKFAFTVVPFGWSLAPMVMQEWVAHMVGRLQPATREALSQFYDDLHLRCTEWAAFTAAVRDVFNALRACRALLKPPKVALGSASGRFYGVMLHADGTSSLAAELTAPLRAWAAPTNVSEVRSLLGTFQVCRDYVADMAATLSPIQRLTRKGVAFEWTAACQAAAERVVGDICSGVRLYSPDFSRRLVLATDASDAGLGGVLYQMVPAGSGGEQRRVVCFFSKSWTPALAVTPVFYREAYALLYCLERSKLWALSSPFPVRCEVDQVSLRWVRHSSKGAVTSFLLDRLADVRFEVVYVRGPTNIADGLSRYPMLGPRQWQWAGLEALFQLLETAVSGLLAEATSVWVYAGNDTAQLQRLVREAAPMARLTHTALAAGFESATDFAVLAPAPDRAPAACARMLRRGMPGACLVPSDLVVQVPVVLEGTADDGVAAALRAASFVGSASAGFLWVVTGRPKADVVVAPVVAGARGGGGDHDDADHGDGGRDGNGSSGGRERDREGGRGGVRDDTVVHSNDGQEGGRDNGGRSGRDGGDHVGGAVHDSAGGVSLGKALEPGPHIDVRGWRGRQLDSLPAGLPGRLVTDGDGLCWYWRDGEQPRLVVPAQERAAVTARAHDDAVGHLGAAQTTEEVLRRFWWPGLRHDVRSYIESCLVCARNKGVRRLAHGNYRGVSYSGPRLFYGCDVKKVGDAGYILLLVDLFSGYLILAPMQSRKAAEVAATVVASVFLVYGAARDIRCDDAREFTSTSFVGHLQRWGCGVSFTKGYHGEGNGAAERAWPYVEARLCESISLVDWRERLPCIAFSFNVAVRGGHGMSAFELQFGLPAVTALQAASLPPVDAAAAARPASKAEAPQLLELFRVNSELAQTARDFQRRATAELLRSASGSRRAVRFAVGDLVMVFREPIDVKETLFTKPKDFVAPWLGPFVVLRVEGTCYTVQALCDGPGITAGAVLERTVKNVKAFKGTAPARAGGGGGGGGDPDGHGSGGGREGDRGKGRGSVQGGGTHDRGGGAHDGGGDATVDGGAGGGADDGGGDPDSHGSGGGREHDRVRGRGSVHDSGAQDRGGGAHDGGGDATGASGTGGGADDDGGGAAGAEDWEFELEVPASWQPGTVLKFIHEGVEYEVSLEGDVVPGGVVAVRVPARGFR